MDNDKCPVLKLREWVVITENGIWDYNSISYKTKALAIEEVSYARLDTNEKPRVTRIHTGCYWYYPRDVDTGEYGEHYTIQNVTSENIVWLQSLLEEQWSIDESTIW